MLTKKKTAMMLKTILPSLPWVVINNTTAAKIAQFTLYTVGLCNIIPELNDTSKQIKQDKAA